MKASGNAVLRPARGFSLIEVLVTILILTVGLLGLAGLQSRALTSQMEAYQRSQALILLKDMADRINANRSDAASYVTTLGTGAACPAAGLTVASVDLNEWCEALMGAAEVQSGANIGEYLVAVAWQGFNSTAIPAIDCGEDQYGDETKRRVVALPLTIADLN